MYNLENIGNDVKSTEFDEFFFVERRVHANNFCKDFRHLGLGKHAACHNVQTERQSNDS